MVNGGVVEQGKMWEFRRVKSVGSEGQGKRGYGRRRQEEKW